MRALFDTNVLPAAFREFERILAKKFGATKQERDAALALIAEAAVESVKPSEIPTGACRDKDDDQVPACAVEGAADRLVTGDKDLLHLKTFRGIGIITPREFELLFDR